MKNLNAALSIRSFSFALGLVLASSSLASCYGGGAEPVASTSQAIVFCPAGYGPLPNVYQSTCSYGLRSMDPVGEVGADSSTGAPTCVIDCNCGFEQVGPAPICPQGVPAEGDYPRACAPMAHRRPGTTIELAHDRSIDPVTACNQAAEGLHARCIGVCRRYADGAATTHIDEEPILQTPAELFCCLPRTRTTTPPVSSLTLESVERAPQLEQISPE